MDGINNRIGLLEYTVILDEEAHELFEVTGKNGRYDITLKRYTLKHKEDAENICNDINKLINDWLDCKL